MHALPELSGPAHAAAVHAGVHGATVHATHAAVHAVHATVHATAHATVHAAVNGAVLAAGALGLLVACGSAGCRPARAPEAPTPGGFDAAPGGGARPGATGAPDSATGAAGAGDPTGAASRGRWIVLVAHEPTQARARFLPVEMPAGWPAAGAPALGPGAAVELPALPRDSWPGHFQVVAASGGDRLVVAVPGAPAASGGDGAAGAVGASWRLEHRQLGAGAGAGAGTVELGPVRPAALRVVGARVVVGTDGRVGLIDLAAGAPAYATVHERAAVAHKPYDLFARDGDVVVAIDDVVMPILADTFRVGADGRLTHLAAWDMPGVINGTYAHAALAMRTPTEGTLYAVAPYGIMDGWGHDLVALPIREARAVFPEDLVLQNGRGSVVPILEEHVPRDPRRAKEQALAAGLEFSSWTGLGVLPPVGAGAGRLAIAAGPRGLLLLPLDFGPESKAAVVDLGGGGCRDLIVRGDLVIALADEVPVATERSRPPASRLVTLRWDGATLAKAAEDVVVPGAYTSFVD